MIISVRASELGPLEICPGKHAMEKGLPNSDSELSKKGVLLHHHDAHPELDRSFLSPSDQDLLRKAKELDDIVMQRVTEQFSLDGQPYEGQREVFGKFSEDGYEITGHPDEIRFYEKLTVIAEKKFGFIEQTPADINKQLRAYSVIFAKEESVVALEQPRQPRDQQLTIAHYTKDDLKDSWKEIRGILEEAADPYAPLHATEDSCRYCRAKLVCKEFRSKMMVTLPLTPDKALSKAAREAYLAQRLSEMTDEQLEQIHNAKQLAGFIDGILQDEERKRINAGRYINFKLANESEVRDVVNPRTGVALLNLAGLPKDSVWNCVGGISLTKVESELRKLHPTWSAKEAREFVDSKLSSVIEKETRKARVLRK